MEDRVDAMVDVGGGETALTRVIAELPLADSLEEQGIRVVVVHMVGPDAADLDYLDSFEDGGLFAAPATLVVQNAGLVMTGGIDEAFASIYDHRTVGRVRTRGGIVVQMPRLICMNDSEKFVSLALNPVVFALAMLLPMTSISVWLESMPLTPENND